MNMKRIAFGLIAISLLALTACEKEKQVADFNNLGIGSYLTKDKVINDQLNFSDLNNTSVGVTVGHKGVEPEKVTVYVTEGASKQKNRAVWKKVKEVPYAGSGSTTITTKATEIATALGIPVTGLKPGQTYMLYNQITGTDGKIYDLANTGGDFEAIANYNMALTFPAIIICPYVPAEAVGQWKVLVDQWDLLDGTVITVGAGDVAPGKFTFALYPSPAFGGVNQKPITVDVAAATGAATVPSQVYGDYLGFDTNVKARSVGTGNWIFSCSGTFIIRMNHSGSGDYGNFLLQMQKQ
jgi:hypothetical protein